MFHSYRTLQKFMVLFIGNHKQPRIAAEILRKKSKAGGITIPDTKLYYKTTVIKTACYWHKKQTDRPMEQNREPRIKTKFLCSINFKKGVSSIKWSKNSLFNKLFWESWTATCKKMKCDHQLTPYTKINSRWTKDLNISHKLIKVLENSMHRKISDISCSSIFTVMSARARDIKERINK